MLLTVVLMFTLLTRCRGACSFPSDLTGVWYSTSFGTLTFTNTSFSGFTGISAAALTFTCDKMSGSQYVSKATTQLFVGVQINTYLCMNLVKLSSIKYYFTLDSDRDSGTGIRFSTADSGVNKSLAEACTVTDTRSPGEFELLVKKANITAALTACPIHLQSLFDVVMTTSSVSNCNGTRLDGRGSNSLSFNYSSCVRGAFNSGGYLSCLHYASSGVVYVTLYNNDTAVDSTTKHRFTCLAYSTSGAVLLATESPGSCDPAQTPTYVNGGVTYTMTDTLYTEEKKDNTVLIIVVVVCCVAFVIIVVVIIIIVYCKVCRKPKPEEPPKVRKRKRKVSITDYTSGLSRSASVEKELQVKKKTAGEILTGTLTDRKDAVIDGGAYVPPPKQQWQRDWEVKFRPPTPGRKDSRQAATPFPGLTKADKSASLPDNLNRKLEARIDMEPATTASLEHLPYSERSHALARVPESTGKFGGSPKPHRLVESLISGLDTIRENPLSRESTGTNLKLPQETRRTGVASVRTDNRSLLSTAMTSSTLSARDIFLNSHTNLSRSSRFSASNVSIFDDPTWLNENSKKSDSFFEVLKNLIPGLPGKKAKDQKWFTSSQAKPEITREDIEYFRNRNKKGVGISGSKTRSTTSLAIIAREREKQKAGKRTTKIQPKIVQPASAPQF